MVDFIKPKAKIIRGRAADFLQRREEAIMDNYVDRGGMLVTTDETGNHEYHLLMTRYD